MSYLHRTGRRPRHGDSPDYTAPGPSQRREMRPQMIPRALPSVIGAHSDARTVPPICRCRWLNPEQVSAVPELGIRCAGIGDSAGLAVGAALPNPGARLIGARLRANKPAHVQLAGLAILKLGGPNWMIGIVGYQ